MGAGEPQRALPALVSGTRVAAGPGNALDAAVGAQAAQVVGPSAGGEVLGGRAELGRRAACAGVSVGVEARGASRRWTTQGLQQGEHSGVAEAQSGQFGSRSR